MASILSLILGLLGCSEKGNTPEKIDLFPKEEFSVIEGTLNNKNPAIGSINMAYKNFKYKKDYPWCLKIEIGLDQDNLYENGLPLPEESKVANQLEDELMAEIQKITTAHYIGHVFNDTFLDIYVYLQEPDEVHKYLQTQINKDSLTRGLGYEIKQDSNWETVSFFLNKKD